MRLCLQTPHSLWVQSSAGVWTSAWTNNWVTGLERPAITSSPSYILCFVPFQVSRKIGWIRQGLISPTKTVRWRPKQQTAMVAAWAMDKTVSWVGQAVFTEVPNFLWLHIRVQSVCELFHTSWTCFLSLQASERSKLWSLPVYLKSIVKRKRLCKTWRHHSNKIRSQNC